MTAFSRIDVSEFTDLNSVARWYIVLRWVAIAGVATVLVASPYFWPVSLPLGILVSITLALAILNALFHWYFRVVRGASLLRTEIGVFFEVQVFCDYLLLSLLVYFTGFLENPFLYFFVFHILLAAYLFTAPVVWRYVAVLVVTAAVVSVLEYRRILPHWSLYDSGSEVYFGQIPLRLLGFCSTIAIAGYLGASINRRLKDTTQSVEIELDRYKSLDKIKSNFILQVTHELRGPLAAVKGYHEMIERGITGPVQPGTIDVLEKATRRTDGLLTMIDEMLDYAYMENDDEKRFESMELSFRDVIEANVEAVGATASEKDIRIEIRCAADRMVQANRDLLNIILSNLLTNAIRYSPKGSTVHLNVTTVGREVMLEVKDEGMGMSAEELDHIFEEFYRTRKARDVEKNGTGLGLSIIKKAVERLGGRILVASEEGKGSSFHIYLPKED